MSDLDVVCYRCRLLAIGYMSFDNVLLASHTTGPPSPNRSYRFPTSPNAYILTILQGAMRELAVVKGSVYNLGAKVKAGRSVMKCCPSVSGASNSENKGGMALMRPQREQRVLGIPNGG